MFRMMRDRVMVSAVVVVIGLAGLLTYLLWPAPTLDAADLDAALPTQRDLPGFVPHDGLTSALSVPPTNKDGRSVLAGPALDEQCRKWRQEGDDWACEHVHGAGMVNLELSENVFFRVQSTVLAYDDQDSAEAAWDGLVTDNRNTIKAGDRVDVGERSPDLGDESLSFEGENVTVLAIRVETVVIEATIWDGSDQVSEQDERDRAEKWPALQISKIENLLS